MSDYNLSLSVRTETGKQSLALRKTGLIPSVIYGGKTEILAKSPYNETEKVLRLAGYHSPIDLKIDDKKTLAIVKNISIDPVSRRIISVSFKAISARKAVEATTPIVLENFESSEASKNHLSLSQQMEEIDVKAKPSALPKEIRADASKLATLDDKIFVKDLILPENVEFANKELDSEQVVAVLFDVAAEAEAREKADAEAAKEGTPNAADVPADNGTKPEEPAPEEEKSE